MAEDAGTTKTAYAALADELALEEAACVTAVRGADVQEVIRLFGGDPEQARSAVLGEALAEAVDLADGGGGPDEGGTGPHIAVAQAGPAVVVVEYGGFQGSREEVLRPLSLLGGRAASAYWNDEALSQLSLAEDGLVLSAFEMLFPDVRQGAAPEAWDAYLDGLAFGAEEDWPSAGLAALARATGARLDAAWAAGPHRYVRITEPPSAVLHQGWEGSPLLAEEPFRGFLADLGPHAVPAMERYAVELAARHHGVADDALCTLALAVLDGCGPPEGRARLGPDLAGRAAEASAEEHRGAGGRSAEGRAAVWRVLGDLLARDAGAPAAGPPAMFHLSRAMAGPHESPEAVRFQLLDALYGAAQRTRP